MFLIYAPQGAESRADNAVKTIVKVGSSRGCSSGGKPMGAELQQGVYSYTRPVSGDDWPGGSGIYFMEKIAGAAIRVRGRIFVGSTHFEATSKYINNFEVVDVAFEDGYVTDSGRFINREEAFYIAVRGGQAHGELADPARNMAFYGTNHPRLDSSIIERYEPIRAANDFF